MNDMVNAKLTKDVNLVIPVRSVIFVDTAIPTERTWISCIRVS